MLADIEQAQGFSSGSYALSLGLSAGIATAVPYVLGTCVTALMWIALRRGGPRADAHGFLLATAALIAFSPIVWLHYLVLLLVPLAVLRPRLSVAWLMPSLMWVMPFAAYTPANPVHRTVFLAALTGTGRVRARPAAVRCGCSPASRAVVLAQSPNGDEADLPRSHRVLRPLRRVAERRRSGGAHRRGLVAGPVALELVPGTGGVFDVDLDGERIFFKKMIGRYPQPEDVLPLLRERIGPELL